MGDDILSKDELDALMDGVRTGDVATAGPAAPGEVRAHDFARHDRVPQAKLPVFEQIQSRTARHLRENFYRTLRRRYEVTPDAIALESYADALSAIAPTASLHVVRTRPLRGNGLVAIDGALASAFVDQFFGGAGRAQPDAKPRELTAGEFRTVQIAVREILTAVTAAWGPVTPLEFDIAGASANLQFATLIPVDETVATARLSIAFEGGEGTVRVVLPLAMFEPVRHLLDGRPNGGERPERDERWATTLRDDVLDAEIELASNLVETNIRIGDFLKLRPGDVIPVELPELITLVSDEVPLFQARFGTSNGNNAVRVVDGTGRRRAPEATSE
jgi:flagellar motor switch protein FliM